MSVLRSYLLGLIVAHMAWLFSFTTGREFGDLQLVLPFSSEIWSADVQHFCRSIGRKRSAATPCPRVVVRPVVEHRREVALRKRQGLDQPGVVPSRWKNPLKFPESVRGPTSRGRDRDKPFRAIHRKGFALCFLKQQVIGHSQFWDRQRSKRTARNSSSDKNCKKNRGRHARGSSLPAEYP